MAPVCGFCIGSLAAGIYNIYGVNNYTGLVSLGIFVAVFLLSTLFGLVAVVIARLRHEDKHSFTITGFCLNLLLLILGRSAILTR